MGSAFEAVRGFYEQAAEKLGLELSLREALSTHAREVSVQVRVPMDFGGFKYEGKRGTGYFLLSAAPMSWVATNDESANTITNAKIRWIISAPLNLELSNV